MDPVNRISSTARISLELPKDPTPIFHLEGVAKRFGAIWANRNISVDFLEGEIHALVGENGAGKSTLLKLLFGHIQPDHGRIYWRGRRVAFHHPFQAQRVGIGMVHQQLLIFPRLGTLENIIVGAETSRFGWLNKRRTRSRIAALCEQFGFDLPLDIPASELTYAHRQQVEIVRMLHRGAKVLLLDEPTSLLAPPEVARFLDLLLNLKAQGHTIVFVSHRLEEVFAIADRISVLAGGRIIASSLAAEVSQDQVAQQILSLQEAPISFPAANATVSPVLSEQPAYPQVETAPDGGWDKQLVPCLELKGVSTKPAGHETPLVELSFSIAEPGDIVGLGGIVGNGLRTLAHVLSGFSSFVRGQITYHGEDLSRLSAVQRAQLGFRWLPANPLEEALLPWNSLWENMLLGHQRDRHLQAYGLLRRARVIARSIELLDAHGVRFLNPAQHLKTLSGGNQQRLALARALAGHPRMVILEQPGRGLDIQAQRLLCRQVRSLSTTGTTFLVLSYDLDELLTMCHRVGILYRGRLMGMVTQDMVQRDQLGSWMLGLE